MIYVSKNQSVDISIDVYKGASSVKEDFSRAELAVFLICGDAKYRHAVRYTINEFGSIKIKGELNDEGVYGIKLIWIKNKRSVMCCEQYNLFAITPYAEEATNPNAFEVKMRFSMHTATYGYDGLDAYELSVLRGKTNLSEDKWLDMINNAGGGSAVVKPITRTEGKWKFVYNLDKNVADPEGEPINYSASLSRINTIFYSDGHTEDQTETGKVSVTTNNAEAASVKDGYIEFKPNMTASERTIVVTFTPSAEGEASKSISVKQAPAAQIVLKSGKDEAGRTVLNTDTNTIVCYDDRIIIDFEKRGNVGEVTAEFLDGFDSWDVEISGNKIAIDVFPNNTSSVVEAKLCIKFGNGKSIDIEIYQTYIKSTTYNDATATITCADISAEGTGAKTITPVIRYSQTCTEVRSDDTQITKPAEHKGISYEKVEGEEGFTINQQGQITYKIANATTSKTKVGSIKVTITTADNKTISATTDVYQSGAVLKMMVGVLKASVSGFNYKTALASNITGKMIEAAIVAGDIAKTEERTSSNPVSFNGDFCDYFVGLIPADSAFNAYQWKMFDGISAYVAFDNDDNRYSNGSLTVTINGSNYKLYCMYVAGDGDDVKLINK